MAGRQKVTQMSAALRRFVGWVQSPIKLFCALVALLPLIYLIYYMAQYGNRFPMDEDTIRLQVPIVLSIQTDQFTLSDLLRPFNGHRHLFSLLTSSALLYINQWDLRAELALMLCMGVINVGLLMSLWVRHSPKISHWLLIPASVLMLSTQLGLIWLSITYTSWHYGLLFTLLALTVLDQRRESWGTLLLSAGLCWAALYSLGNGATSWVMVGVYMLLTPAYRRLPKLGVIIAIGALSVALYSWGINDDRTTTSFTQMLSPPIWTVIQSSLTFLGSPIGLHQAVLSAWIGGIGIIVFVLNGLSLWFSGIQQASRPWIALGVSFISLSGLIAIARYQYGYGLILHERFSHPTSAFWVTIIALSVLVVHHQETIKRRWSGALVRLNVLLLVSIAGLYIPTAYQRTQSFDNLSHPIARQTLFMVCFAGYPLRATDSCTDYDGNPIPDYRSEPRDQMAAFNIAGYQNLPRRNLLEGRYQPEDAVIIASDDAWFSVHVRDRLLHGIPAENVYHWIPIPDEQSLAVMEKLPHPPQIINTLPEPQPSTLWILQRSFFATPPTIPPEGYAIASQATLDYEMTLSQWIRLPDFDKTPITYGEQLTAVHWHIPHDLTVQACATIPLETYWVAERPLTDDFSLTFTAASQDGNGIAQSDGITSVPSSQWAANAPYFDRREVEIPCRTPAGSYNLLLGVYDATSLIPLAATHPDGSPLGDIVYLTTLQVID